MARTVPGLRARNSDTDTAKRALLGRYPICFASYFARTSPLGTGSTRTSIGVIDFGFSPPAQLKGLGLFVHGAATFLIHDQPPQGIVPGRHLLYKA